MTKYVQSHLLQNCCMRERVNKVFNNISVISRWPVHILLYFVTFPHQYSTQRTFKQLAAFPHRLLVYRSWWMFSVNPNVILSKFSNVAISTSVIKTISLKMNSACHSDFCQTSEIMLTKKGFKITTSGLTACVTTNWVNCLPWFNPFPHTTILQQTTILLGKIWCGFQHCFRIYHLIKLGS